MQKDLNTFINENLPSKSGGLASFDLRIAETLMQIQKDFSLHGLNIDLSSKSISKYQGLLVELRDVIEELSKSKSNVLVNIVYQVDLNERLLRQKFQKSPIEEHSEILAKLIIDRSYKKVLTRYYFKNLT